MAKRYYVGTCPVGCEGYNLHSEWPFASFREAQHKAKELKKEGFKVRLYRYDEQGLTIF